jgi:sec-independent protein translocase protein TatA
VSSIGAPELIIILIVVLLLFGSTRLPKLARSIGQASKEFKEGVKEGGRDDDTASTSTSTAGATALPKSTDDEQVTMSRAELDRLLAEREAAARRDDPPAP